MNHVTTIELQPEEVHLARNLWRDLMTAAPAAREHFAAAPAKIREAILTAAPQVVSTNEPKNNENNGNNGN